MNEQQRDRNGTRARMSAAYIIEDENVLEIKKY